RTPSRTRRARTQRKAMRGTWKWTCWRATSRGCWGRAPTPAGTGGAEMAFATVPGLLGEVRQGRMVVIVDDEDRENEGDLIMAAELARPADINYMVTHARGLVCLSLTGER